MGAASGPATLSTLADVTPAAASGRTNVRVTSAFPVDTRSVVRRSTTTMMAARAAFPSILGSEPVNERLRFAVRHGVHLVGV